MSDTGGFEVLSEELVRTGPVVTTWMLDIQTPDNEVMDREVTRHPGAVAVVAIDADDQILFLRQYRAPLNALLFEIPAGKRDVPGEPPELTANRELLEETGYTAGSMELLGIFVNSPGFCDERTYVFCARDLTEAERDVDGPEEQHAELVRRPVAEAHDMVTSGEIEDAKTLLGLQWLLLTR